MLCSFFFFFYLFFFFEILSSVGIMQVYPPVAVFLPGLSSSFSYDCPGALPWALFLGYTVLRNQILSRNRRLSDLPVRPRALIRESCLLTFPLDSLIDILKFPGLSKSSASNLFPPTFPHTGLLHPAKWWTIQLLRCHSWFLSSLNPSEGPVSSTKYSVHPNLSTFHHVLC